MLVNITGGSDLTLLEVDEAAERVTRVSCCAFWVHLTVANFELQGN